MTTRWVSKDANKKSTFLFWRHKLQFFFIWLYFLYSGVLAETNFVTRLSFDPNKQKNVKEAKFHTSFNSSLSLATKRFLALLLSIDLLSLLKWDLDLNCIVGFFCLFGDVGVGYVCHRFKVPAVLSCKPSELQLVVSHGISQLSSVFLFFDIFSTIKLFFFFFYLLLHY